MSRTTMFLLAAGVSLLALTGCGTFWNFNAKVGEPPCLPYGGVSNDVKQGVGQIACVAGAGEQPGYAVVMLGGAVYWLTIDLALSAVADTLTLPITIPAFVRKECLAHRPSERPSPPTDPGDRSIPIPESPP